MASVNHAAQRARAGGQPKGGASSPFTTILQHSRPQHSPTNSAILRRGAARGECAECFAAIKACPVSYPLDATGPSLTLVANKHQPYLFHATRFAHRLRPADADLSGGE